MANTKEITVKIEGAEWEDAKNKAYEKASKKVHIDGFRPGKAPKEVFLKKYKEESLFMDAGDLVIEKAYSKMIEENADLQIVAQPEMQLKSIDSKGIEFSFILTLRPEVKLGQYKNLGVKKEEVNVTEEEIDEAIKQMQEKYAEVVEKKEDSVVENNDTVILDFEGFKDGIAFEGGKGENYSLTIGSHTFIPGFEEQLIGMKKEEEKEIEVTFPEDYHSEDLKGQKAIFKVKVHEIKTTIIPEIGKEFFEDLDMDGINDIESLRKQVKENIEAHKKHHAEEHYMDELLETAAKNVEIDIPDVMLKEELDRMIKQYEEHLKMQGISLEQFYQFTSSSEEALREQMKEEATKRITFRLMLEEIAKVENIEVSDEEASKEAEEMATKYQMSKEELIQAFGGLDMIKYDVKMKKTLELLKD